MELNRKKVSASLAVLATTVMFVLGLFVGDNVTTKVSGADETASVAGVNTAASQNIGASNSYAQIVSRVAPAVVTVRSEGRGRQAQQFPFADDPTLREFFGNRGIVPQQPRERRRSGLGSGVIVSSDGYILTNHHVIDGAEKITVQLTNNRTLDAKVVGSDAPSDLAVLKVEGRELPMLPLGDSDQMRVGDVVLAIGNPLGVGQTVTSGIISAKGRRTGLSDGSFEDFLQTDAAINQGNSGGALVNTNGELVGINSQILSPSGGNIGIGFSIPSKMAKNVMDQLVKTGAVRRGQLGVTVQQVTSEIAASIGVSDARGVIVSGVQPGSAAERAGLRQGDIIAQFNGTKVDDSNAFRNHVASTMPGTEVALTVMRDREEQQVRATLGELSGEKKGESVNTRNDETTSSGKLGINAQDLTPEVAAQFRLPAGTKGVVVGGVAPGGAAAEAGIVEGDVILEFNRQKVGSVAELQKVVGASSDRPALMLINRRGDNFYLTAKLG